MPKNIPSDLPEPEAPPTLTDVYAGVEYQAEADAMKDAINAGKNPPGASTFEDDE